MTKELYDCNGLFGNYLARRIDGKIEALGYKYGSEGKLAVLLLKRFLDDTLKVFVGTTKQLHTLFKEMNEIHTKLKFTINHTSQKNEAKEDRCQCELLQSIPFF